MFGQVDVVDRSGVEVDSVEAVAGAVDDLEPGVVLHGEVD